MKTDAPEVAALTPTELRALAKDYDAYSVSSRWGLPTRQKFVVIAGALRFMADVLDALGEPYSNSLEAKPLTPEAIARSQALFDELVVRAPEPETTFEYDETTENMTIRTTFTVPAEFDFQETDLTRDWEVFIQRRTAAWVRALRERVPQSGDTQGTQAEAKHDEADGPHHDTTSSTH